MSRQEPPTAREAYLSGLVFGALLSHGGLGFRFRPVTTGDGIFMSEIDILDETDALVGKVLVREMEHLR